MRCWSFRLRIRFGRDWLCETMVSLCRTDRTNQGLRAANMPNNLGVHRDSETGWRLRTGTGGKGMPRAFWLVSRRRIHLHRDIVTN